MQASPNFLMPRQFKKRGRPKGKDTDQVILRMPLDFLEWIDDWAQVNTNNNRSDAIRMAVNAAMVIDIEYRELIDEEFAGDYQFFLKRACQEAYERWQEVRYAEEHA